MDDLIALFIALLPAALCWTAAYAFCRLALRSRSPDFSNRVVSIAHAVLATALAVPSLDWARPLATVGQANTAAQTLCMRVSLAYFLYDTLCCFFIDFDPMGLAHHLCTIAGLLVGVRDGRCGTELVACLLLMEVSNPSMHLNQLLKELKRGDTRLAAANQALFALIFFVCRLVVGPVVVYRTVVSPTTPLVVKAGGVGILLVSLLWFNKIAQIALYKFRKAGKKGGGAAARKKSKH